jgi:hypothetical protein
LFSNCFVFVFVFVCYIWIYFIWLHDIASAERSIGPDCRKYRYVGEHTSESIKQKYKSKVHPPLNITGKMHLHHQCKFEFDPTKFNPLIHCKIDEQHETNRKLYTHITHSTSTPSQIFIQNIYFERIYATTNH